MWSTKDLFTAGAAMFAAAALFYSAHCYQAGRNNQNSEFYLKQIPKYFQDALNSIKSDDNNNIKWHQGIDCLKTAEDLSDKLTELQHQTIYVADYINTGYAIINVLNRIDSYKFFFGINPYKNIEDDQLFEDSAVVGCEFLEKNCYRIEPESLVALNAFIAKAGFGREGIEQNWFSHQTFFAMPYFKKRIKHFKEMLELDIFSKQKIISAYINTYKIRENEKEARLKLADSELIKNFEEELSQDSSEQKI